MEKNLKVIQLVSDDFEDLELWYPVYRLREAGIQVDLVGPEKNKKYVGKYGVPATSDYSFDEIKPSDYDGILVHGHLIYSDVSNRSLLWLNTLIMLSYQLDKSAMLDGS